MELGLRTLQSAAPSLEAMNIPIEDLEIIVEALGKIIALTHR